MQTTWVLNTSNPGKRDEFRQHFERNGITLNSSSIDLEEIDSDPISVVVHKACQVDEGVFVEDTSLDIEGAEVGINVRWMFDHLITLCGRKATWRVLLAYRKQDLVYVYEGKTEGTIVQPSGEWGFGFDPIFKPNGYDVTLAHSKPSDVDARAHVVKAFLENKPIAVVPPITHWDGPWQS